jgi:group I intron endonuclease
MIIYCIRNKINGKCYVGKYSNCKSNEEFQQSSYWGSGKIIIRAIKKYGITNFEKIILIKNIKSLNELNRYEKLWIKKLNSFIPNGYNLASGGDGGNTWINCSEEERKIRSNKLSKSTKGKKKKPFTEEHKNNLRGTKSELHKQHMRHPKSEEGRKNIGHHDAKGSKNPMFNNGYRISGEKNGMFGVHRYGEKSPASKLTWKIVNEIRNSNLKRSELARKFNVSWTTINTIKKMQLGK